MSLFSVVRGLVGIADPNNPTNVLKPNSDGSLNLGTGAASPSKATNTAFVSGDVGSPALAVRKDTPIALASPDGKYTSLITDASGGLWAALESGGTPVDFSGITTVARQLTTTADTNSVNVKNAAGRIYYIRGVSHRASAAYLKLYNKASAPTVGTDVPVDTIELAPNQPFVLDFPAGLAFSIGIGFGIVTAAADASTAAMTAGDVTCLAIGYA